MFQGVNFINLYKCSGSLMFGCFPLQRRTSPARQVAMVTKMLFGAPNICGFTVLNLLHVPLQAHRILKWLVEFSTIFTPLYQYCFNNRPDYDVNSVWCGVPLHAATEDILPTSCFLPQITGTSLEVRNKRKCQRLQQQPLPEFSNLIVRKGLKKRTFVQTLPNFRSFKLRYFTRAI